ncbi:hypothetical protein PR048_030888 [Dryococelus australis]|uniref:Uncharacterized protein n=1 Tax=Dryococelus australis TaxID=614101 RepID=A0ABQ9GA59_9NEOP|nr:hypothetical protein PR048_030888 [Dryococelus australis]
MKQKGFVCRYGEVRSRDAITGEANTRRVTGFPAGTCSCPSSPDMTLNETLRRRCTRMQGRGKREHSEKTRRQAASSSTNPTCENPGANPPGIEPGSSWWLGKEHDENTTRQFRDLRLVAMAHLLRVAVSPLSLPCFSDSNADKSCRLYSLTYVQICRNQLYVGCLPSQWKATIGHRSLGRVKRRVDQSLVCSVTGRRACRSMTVTTADCVIWSHESTSSISPRIVTLGSAATPPIVVYLPRGEYFSGRRRFLSWSRYRRCCGSRRGRGQCTAETVVLRAEKRRSYKGHTGTHYKSYIASKRRLEHIASCGVDSNQTAHRVVWCRLKHIASCGTQAHLVVWCRLKHIASCGVDSSTSRRVTWGYFLSVVANFTGHMSVRLMWSRQDESRRVLLAYSLCPLRETKNKVLLNYSCAVYSKSSGLAINFPHTLKGRGDVVVRLLASHLGEPGSIPGGVAPRFSQVGRYRWSAGFLRDLRFPPPSHSGTAACSPQFTLIGSQDLTVKSYPDIFTLHSNNIEDYGKLECEMRYGAAPECKSRGKRKISEKTRQPATKSGTIPTCENPGNDALGGMQKCKSGLYHGLPLTPAKWRHRGATCQRLGTYSPAGSPANREFFAARGSQSDSRGLFQSFTQPISEPPQHFTSVLSPVLWQVIEVNMERRRNEGAGETGGETWFALVGGERANRSATVAPCAVESEAEA